MTAVAGDVPSKFDVVINGEGYLHADVQDIKGEYGYTPTFVNRQNTQGDYGDNQQDFWLTATQRDWSLGEQQRYFRANDDDAKRRYWVGTNVNVNERPGQVSLRSLTTTTSAFGSAVRDMVGDNNLDTIYASGSTNLYRIAADGTITDHGAHGLGTQPTAMSMGGAFGGVYMSSVVGGTVGVRKWSGAAFSTFSATPAHSLAFVGNTLYGIDHINATFQRYDTAGTATTIFTWKDAAGGTIGSRSYLASFGGKVLILRGTDAEGTLLYLYDGTAPAVVARFASSFLGHSIAVVNGTVFIGGLSHKRFSSATYVRPTIYYYSNGSIGKLWQADSYISTSTVFTDYIPQVSGFADGLIFQDDTVGSLMYYDPSAGGVHTIGTYTAATGDVRLVATRDFALLSRVSTTPYRFPSDGFSTSGTVISSLFDFDSSLTKLVRGIKVEFDSATDGNGGTVDIAYRVGDVDGSYTSLQTGATSGTEYALTGISGRSVSVKVTLNKGTSTAGPVLKRVSVRAVGIETGFKKFTLVLQLSGTKALDGQMMQLRDGRPHTKSGEEMADNLFTAAAATAPFAVTTELHGTIPSCVIDQENFKVQRIRKNEYIAYVPVREV